MRVTNSMMITNMLANLNKNLNVMSRKQDELSTGKKVIFASDNPVAAAKILKFKTDIADMEQYSTNTRDAQALLDASESSIAEMGNVLQRVRELAVQGANGTLTPSDTQKIREEILQLRDHLISGGNANFAGKYMFSSHYTDKKLLTDDGKYNIPITAEDITNLPVAIYEISPKEFMPVGTHGVEIFGYNLDTSAFTANMPNDTTVKGIAAQKSAVQADFSLTTDYTAATLGVTVNGAYFSVDTSAMDGAPLAPLDMQKVLDQYKAATNGTTRLSDVADVYFDNNKKLVIRNKTVGTGGSVALTASTGLTNGMNVTSPGAPVPLGTISTLVSGVNANNISVTGTGSIAPVADFYGKSFVMTYNGLTKTITFPTTGTAAALLSGIQSSIDTAFGAGKITVSDGPLSFQTNTALTDPTQPQLRIQNVVTSESELIKDLNDFIGYLNTGDSTNISNVLGKVDKHLQQLLAVRADIGARGSRLELIDSRIAENSVTFTRLLSNSQDADMAEVIMYLKNAENVYKSALSVGGKIIQPSLLDFLR